MKNLSPIYDLIRADGSVVINKNLMFSLGMNEAIIYTELIAKYNYFNIRESLTDDGYFFNTVDNLLLDTSLGEKVQRTVIKNLQKLKLIKYKVKGIPPKRYFKIIENPELLLEYIESGRNTRELLEKKLATSADISKLRILGGIKNANNAESILTNGSVNNTKVKNTKPNNTNERYIILPNDVTFLKTYSFYFKREIGKEHMKIKESKLDEILGWINSLEEYGIDEEYFEEQTVLHFENLPKGNTGNILSFIESSHRYFEVPNPKQSNY
ncbi:MAG TPA: hypothetical protein VIK72_19300 [Clostridiaceae bacterium]